MKLFRLAVALASATMLWGCNSSSSTGPSTNTSTTITKPNVGTTYTSKTTSTDSTNAIVDSSTVIATVEASGLNIAGKSAVYQFIERTLDGMPKDTGYVHYETNGDISIWSTGNNADVTGWITYPFGSQTTLTRTQDTTIDFGGGPLPLHVSMTAKGTGTGSYTVNGKTFSTRKVNWTFTSTIASQPFLGQTVDLELAPEIGWLVRNSSPGAPDPIDGSMGTSETTILTGYSLK